VLLAAYYFPPSAAVGGLRIARFARILPAFDWSPYVLTVEDRRQDQGTDRSRMDGLSHVPIETIREPPSAVRFYSRVKSSMRGTSGPDSAPAVANAREHSDHRFKRLVVSLLVYLPDELKAWALRASLSAVQVIRRERIDCILTSGPPFSVHLIGLLAKSLTGVRWVADFRDPWIDLLEVRLPSTRSSVSDRIERWMEALVVRRADRVVTTTDRMREAMRRRYPSVPATRFLTVENGIDTEKLQANGSVEKYPELTITYTGTLYFDRTPEPLFRAVGSLIASGKVREDQIRIKLIGNCRRVDDVETMALARAHGVERVVQIQDAIPYPDAVEAMRRSHLLLVLAPEHHRLVVPAKVFDYLGSGSAILGIAEAGATVDLVHDSGAGRCFSTQDVDGLAEYLHGLVQSGSYRVLGNRPEAFARYDVRCLTSRLASEALEGSD